MTEEAALAAYKAAQAEVVRQNALLTQAVAAATAGNAPFGNSSTIVREGYRIPEAAMVVIRALKATQDNANFALDAQQAATNKAVAAKDQAKVDLNNAIIAGDQTGAVESV